MKENEILIGTGNKLGTDWEQTIEDQG